VDAAPEVAEPGVDSLRARDPEALENLHRLLLRAARFEINRRRASFPDLDDLANQCANDALIAILRKLDTFRGESRFTTWAYKFALLEAGVALRRRAWVGRELPLTDDALVALDAGPDERSETGALIEALRKAIDEQLTEHQRTVLVATTLNGVPIDVLADRLDSTRGALYKTLHDARRKLRAHLVELGFDVPGANNV